MTAAELRSLTAAGPVLACSPVELVTPDGRRLEVVHAAAAVPSAPGEGGVERPAGVPVLTLTVRERPAPPAGGG